MTTLIHKHSAADTGTVGLLSANPHSPGTQGGKVATTLLQTWGGGRPDGGPLALKGPCGLVFGAGQSREKTTNQPRPREGGSQAPWAVPGESKGGMSTAPGEVPTGLGVGGLAGVLGQSDCIYSLLSAHPLFLFSPLGTHPHAPQEFAEVQDDKEGTLCPKQVTALLWLPSPIPSSVTTPTLALVILSCHLWGQDCHMGPVGHVKRPQSRPLLPGLSFLPYKEIKKSALRDTVLNALHLFSHLSGQSRSRNQTDAVSQGAGFISGE